MIARSWWQRLVAWLQATPDGIARLNAPAEWPDRGHW